MKKNLDKPEKNDIIIAERISDKKQYLGGTP